MTYPPKSKSNKIESIEKNQIIDSRVYMHFLPYWLINFSISWCIILQENSIPRSMNGDWWIVWLRFIWETQHLLEWHIPQNKSNKIESFALKKYCYTSLHGYFLPYWFINYSISWCMFKKIQFPVQWKANRVATTIFGDTAAF